MSLTPRSESVASSSACCPLADNPLLVFSFLTLCSVLMVNYLFTIWLLFKYDQDFGGSYFILLKGLAPCDINVIFYMMYTMAEKYFRVLAE